MRTDLVYLTPYLKAFSFEVIYLNNVHNLVHLSLFLISPILSFVLDARARPQLQVAMSGVLAPSREAERRTAANGSVCSGSGLAGHPRAEYDVYRTAGEWWTDMTRVKIRKRQVFGSEVSYRNRAVEGE